MSVIGGGGREIFHVKSTRVRRAAAPTAADAIKPKKAKAASRNKKIGKDILHQVFAELEKHAVTKNDRTWQEIFELASRGEFPRNMKYNKNLLIFKYRNQNHELYMCEDDMETLYIAVKGFFQQNIGIFSIEEIKEVRESLREYLSGISKKEPKWSDLTKSEKMKAENMIMTYSRETCKTDEEIDALANAIKMKMYCGACSAGTFEVQDGRLVGVGGIAIDKNGLAYLEECKITPKVQNTRINDNKSDITSVTNVTTSKKKPKKCNMNVIKIFNRLLAIYDGVGGVKSKLVLMKRQVKRRR